MAQDMNHVPVFDAKEQSTDVFLKLDYVKKEQMHFDELLSAIKHDVSDHDADNFVAIYVYRSTDSYAVVGRFRASPKFPSKISEKLQTSLLTQKDLVDLGHRQLYTLNDKGCPTLAQVRCQYGVGYFFNQRKVKQHENLTVLNVYNPNEHVASLDFKFNNAIFTVDDESILGETLYVADEWSRDVRVAINEEAEAAFNAADESSESKNFREYTVNDMVLIKHAGYVRRGSVISCANNICEVLCVDYGIKLRCSTSQLRIAPSNVAYTRFLAIPCVLSGIGRSPSRKVRKYVSELIHQLDRSSAMFVILNKDERALQHIDVLFKDKASGDQISIVKYLEKAGLIKGAEPIQPKCAYDFGELLSLIGNARPIFEFPSEKVASIQRPFVKPAEFLSTNELAKKLGISA